jgi:hypothetical protein
MALIAAGIGIADISGSVGGTTFARNRYGAYARARVKPVNPNSTAQSNARSRLAAMKTLWAALTQAHRDEWETYGANVSMVGRLGQPIKLTGWSHFVRSNTAILGAGLAYVPDAPQTYSLAETDPTAAVSGDESDKKIKVAFDDFLPWCSEVGGAMLVYAGNAVDPNINFYGGPFRYIGKISGAVVKPTTPQSLDPLTNIFEGQRIFVKVRIVRADGRLSGQFQATGLCVA